MVYAEVKTGLLAKKFPTIPTDVKLPSLVEWKNTDRFYFKDRESLSIPKHKSESLLLKAERILLANYDTLVLNGVT